jgi:hypothetical protein
MRHARICGSSEGGWLVLALQNPHRHQLANFLTDEDVHSLPKDMLINGELQVVTVKAAVLSGLPLPPYTYTIAAIVKLKESSSVFLAVCNHMSLQWECVAFLPGNLTIQDLLHYQDAFYLLTSTEDVVMLVMQDGRYHLRDLNVRERASCFLDTMLHSTIKRYLCESEGNLYMIVKFVKEVTLEVRIFQLKVDQDDEDTTVEDDKRASWVDMSESKQLKGRVFFAGRASSRSFDTSEDSRIHFLDDRHALSQDGEYLRDDMRIVSLLDLMVNNFPPVGDAPLPRRTSDRDPSAWLLH